MTPQENKLRPGQLRRFLPADAPFSFVYYVVIGRHPINRSVYDIQVVHSNRINWKQGKHYYLYPYQLIKHEIVVRTSEDVK